MGSYINPSDCSKEQWLADHGIPVHGNRIPRIGELEGFLPVCLVDNGAFTAAGICFNDRELAAFSQPSDYRPKRWFHVSQELLFTVSDLENWLK